MKTKYIQTALGEMAVPSENDFNNLGSHLGETPIAENYLPSKTVAGGIRDIFLVSAVVIAFVIYQAGKKSGR